MLIRSIHIENFRNYRRLDLDVEPSINVFYGENAQGKTNIIEAIYLCTCARSHRTSKDKDLIYHDAEGNSDKGYRIALEIMSSREGTARYQESLALSYQEIPTKGFKTGKIRRVAEQDGVPLERISDFVGLFHGVIFAPEDLLLIKEGPSARRRYVDLLISQVKPSYFHDLMTYSRLLMQRNRALKLLKQRQNIHSLKEEERAEIEVWDHPLAQVSARILVRRIEYTQRIQIIAAEKHGQISGNKEKLRIRYRTISGIITDESRENPASFEKDFEQIIVNRYRSTHQEDYERGITSVGIHRDDLELSLDGDGLRSFASQGQHRSAALALKLAELTILKEDTKEMPVLLLDDVFSELDANRRACLLQNIEDAQVFITCTDKSFIEQELWEKSSKDQSSRRVSFYKVQAGTVTKES